MALDRTTVFERVDAFSPYPSIASKYRAIKSNHMSLQYSTQENYKSTDTIITGKDVSCRQALTSAVLKIAYDGTHFRGWTGWIGDKQTPPNYKSASSNKTKQKQSRRSRTLQRKGSGFIKGSGSIRTVENTLKVSLAKLYGNISPSCVMFDSCSRTDAGVHATSLVVQFYCFSKNGKDLDIDMTTNSDWARLRPKSSTDTDFLPLPFDSNLSKLVFVLNRMLPPDVRVIASSSAPDVSDFTPVRNERGNDARDGIERQSGTFGQSFHPTLHVKSKTYTYQFAVGPVQNPLRSHYIWHLDGSSHRAVGMNGKKFCLQRARDAANVFVESIQPRDYSAFKSSFRGNERGRVQSSICTLWKCELVREPSELLPSWDLQSKNEGGESSTTIKYGSRLADNAFTPGQSSYELANIGTYTVVITGDRFLYKMVRNIVGSIIAVACGHLEVSDIRNSLESPENINDSVRKICAPARGLALSNVEFPDNIAFDWHTG